MKLVYFLVLYCSCISVNAHPPWVCNETEPTTPTLGGLTKADVNDPIIKNISAFALPTINRKFDETFKIARIISAETQVVEGTLYYLRLEVCTTNSNRGEDDPSSECIQTGEANKQLCDVKVWERLWLPEREVTGVNCTAINARRKRELAVSGGPTEDHITYPTIIVGVLTTANVSDPIIKNISAFALPTIDTRLNGTFKIARIVSAETRSAGGTLYYLRLEVCTTNSNRGEDDASSACIQTGEANKHLCDVVVWDRPWQPEREVTDLNCTAINARRKRETIPEGLADADVSEEGVRKAAEFALTEIDKRSNSAYKQTLVQILNAQKQDAAEVRSISFKAADLEEH